MKDINKIFGIGLSRTGTLSLTNALKRLGYKTIHYPNLKHFYYLVEIYDAITDTPVCINYVALDEMYPNSKFILTTRDLTEWLSSAKWFFSRTKQPKLSNQQIFIRETLYGNEYFDRRSYKKGFLDYHDKVLKYFKDRPEDILIMNVFKRDGYNKLCPFLGKETLREKFPHSHNRRKKK